jgi:hypothetical protein
MAICVQKIGRRLCRLSGASIFFSVGWSPSRAESLSEPKPSALPRNNDEGSHFYLTTYVTGVAGPF